MTYLGYAITEVYLIICTLMILFRLNNSIGSEYEVKDLRYMVFANLAMMASDIFWALNEDGIITLAHLPNAAINAVTIAAVSFGCYYWYRFLEDRLQPAYAKRRYSKVLIGIPMVVVLVLDVISIFTGWLFYIDANNHYDTTPLFDIQSFINYFYLLLSTGISLYSAHKTRSKIQRREYLTYAGYMLAPVVAVLLEDVLPTVPILALNTFLVILILFLMIQNMQIYNDALTELNNRRRLNQYLEDRLATASEEHPVALLMMDLNDFKSINDTFGHIEGDNALKAFAQSLKPVADEYNAFIARYGGDEFCLVADIAGHSPDEIEESVHESLRRTLAKKAAGSNSYTISVSIGYVICDKPETDSAAFIGKADAMLYTKKRAWHQENV